MVVQHNIGGIESHDQYEELYKVNPRMEFVLLQQHQETNNKNAKAFRDRARELVMEFFEETADKDRRINHVKWKVFGTAAGAPIMTGEHPVMRACFAVGPPIVEGQFHTHPSAARILLTQGCAHRAHPSPPRAARAARIRRATRICRAARIRPRRAPRAQRAARAARVRPRRAARIRPRRVPRAPRASVPAARSRSHARLAALIQPRISYSCSPPSSIALTGRQVIYVGVLFITTWSRY
jgi:hypothetical protein